MQAKARVCLLFSLYCCFLLSILYFCPLFYISSQYFTVRPKCTYVMHILQYIMLVAYVFWLTLCFFLLAVKKRKTVRKTDNHLMHISCWFVFYFERAHRKPQYLCEHQFDKCKVVLQFPTVTVGGQWRLVINHHQGSLMSLQRFSLSSAEMCILHCQMSKE